jgi:hypothetical protein
VYKNKNTAKTVACVTPGGLTSLVSHSERQIIEQSGLVGAVESCDHVMADKGFDVYFSSC